MALIDPEVDLITPEPLPLRALSQDQQQLLDQLLPMLDGAVVELASGALFTLKARVWMPDTLGNNGYWLASAPPQPSIRILQWNNAPVVLHPERISAIATLLVDADPLLNALELKLATTIEPDQIYGQAPDDALFLSIHFDGSEGTAHHIIFAFPSAFAPPAQGGAADIGMTRAPVVTTIECQVATLDVDDASAISSGDLLILRGGGWKATMDTPFGAVTGRVNPDQDQFSVAAGDPEQEQQQMSDEGNGGDAGGFGALNVPVSIKLPDQALTLEELGRLRAGLAVPIGPITAGLEVKLTVAGRVIALGELVKLGDQFAVHIDRIPSDDIPAAPSSSSIPMPDQSHLSEQDAQDDQF